MHLVFLLKLLFIQSCRLQSWFGPVGSEHVPRRAIWLCKLHSYEKNDTSRCQILLGRYSLQILEVGWKSWGIRKLRYEASLISNACESSQLVMPGINCNAYL